MTNGAFYQSAAYYINTTWGAGGFWIDTTPKSDPGYVDETNFRVSSDGLGTVNVQLVGYQTVQPDGSFPSLNINTTGWYTFKTTFEDNGGFVKNVLSVLDAGGNTVGSASQVSTMPFADLTGPSYGDWTTVWQNGFAQDFLGIDDVELGTIDAPLPPPSKPLSKTAAGSSKHILSVLDKRKHRRQRQPSLHHAIRRSNRSQLRRLRTTVWQNGFAQRFSRHRRCRTGHHRRRCRRPASLASAHAGIGLIAGLGVLAGIKRLRRQPI